MSKMTNTSTLVDYEYTHLDEMATAAFTMAVARLMDSVFETPDKDFETYANDNYQLVEYDPAELFKRYFAAIHDNQLTKYQQQFKGFAEINTSTIYKWFRKNGSSVNISPKQLEWFKRWFVKHRIGHEFLNELDQRYTRSIKPNFNARGTTSTADSLSKLFGAKL